MTVNELLLKGYDILKKAYIESYMIDCQLLLAKVLNISRLDIITNRNIVVSNSAADEYLKLIELRRRKMPIKYILKECEFMGLNFYVDEGVLIPRPDTETLVEQVIGEINRRGYSEICDVCCGSGIIGVSIAKLISTTKVECCDISKNALAVTSENIVRFSLQDRVSVRESDLLTYALQEKRHFDVIAANPPYIREDVIPNLMEDVKYYEPHIALSGGADGLEYYRKITEQSLKVIRAGGLLAFEIGYDQCQEVEAILKDHGYADISCIKDLSNHDRVVKGFRY